MGLRGPKPFSSAQLKLSGDPRSKSRERTELQIEPGMPTPPAWFTKEAKGEWDRVAPVLMKLGILTEQDRALLTIHCQAWGDYEAGQRELAKLVKSKKIFSGHMVDHPRVVMSRAIERMMATADRFGLSSSARAKLGNNGKVKPNGNGIQTTKSKGRFFPDGPATKAV